MRNIRSSEYSKKLKTAHKKEWMERAAHASTIVAAIVAIFAFISGYLQFKDTQALTSINLKLQAETLAHEQESKAIELFIRFNELQKEMVIKPMPKKDRATFWQYNMMLTLTESVFRLTQPDAGWRETVNWMLKTQESFLKSTPQNCHAFAEPFLELMNQVVPNIKCE